MCKIPEDTLNEKRIGKINVACLAGVMSNLYLQFLLCALHQHISVKHVLSDCVNTAHTLVACPAIAQQLSLRAAVERPTNYFRG